MSATAVVAVAGAIATPLVAIAGYIFNEKRSQGDRSAARELAEGQREHEERLRRSDRLYDARRETYLDVLRQLFVELQIVERTENPDSSRAPPAMPPENEWRDLRARVGAFGSPPINDAVEAFDSKVREFHDEVKSNAEQKTPPTREEQAVRDGSLRSRRGEITEDYKRVRTLIRDELANL